MPRNGRTHLLGRAARPLVAAPHFGNRVHAHVGLRGMPKAEVPVRIRVPLADDRKLIGTRTYETCTAKKPGGGPPRL